VQSPHIPNAGVSVRGYHSTGLRKAIHTIAAQTVDEVAIELSNAMFQYLL
jgi:hypothetical protein